MGSSSEESDIRDSVINEYKGKPNELLEAGTYKIRGPNRTFRCPFCAGNEKQDYQYNQLMQHAIELAEDAAKSAKQRANHLALATYMENDTSIESEAILQRVIPSSAAKPEKYIWPWYGVIVNVQNEPKNVNLEDDCGYWLTKFSKFKPSEIEIFRDINQRVGQVVMRFNNDWVGFKNAVEFENSFEAEGRSRKEWIDRKDSPGSSIYGWFAGEDDYKSEGPVGDYFRRKGELKKISDLVLEATIDRNEMLVTMEKTEELKEEMKILYLDGSSLFDEYLALEMSFLRMINFYIILTGGGFVYGFFHLSEIISYILYGILAIVFLVGVGSTTFTSFKKFKKLEPKMKDVISRREKLKKLCADHSQVSLMDNRLESGVLKQDPRITLITISLVCLVYLLYISWIYFISYHRLTLAGEKFDEPRVESSHLVEISVVLFRDS